jgi:hypothetical protein
MAVVGGKGERGVGCLEGGALKPQQGELADSKDS